MSLCKTYFDLPGELEPGASFEADSFGGRNPVTKQAKQLRESARPGSPETRDSFDDTFSLTLSRLREHDPGKFSRGVPTNDKTSSENYPKRNIQIIDGEHKTLTDIGRISEAMDDDDHANHIMEHRMLLANPKLNYSQREALVKHIETHSKKLQKKMKEIAEATGKKMKPGLGVPSIPKPATQYDVIPQDSQVDTERKRTAGNMAMESRMARFDRAIQVSGRRGL